MKRIAEFKRITTETKIKGFVNMDGKGISNIDTGIGFFDHMLTQIVFHSKLDLTLECSGDLHIDPHHTLEDTSIILGNAFKEALGDKLGITRYAFCYLPMDESLTRTSLDISGRPYHVFRGHFSDNVVGTFPTQMVEHFFYSLAINAGITLHQEVLYGNNDHHIIESLFKGFARSWKQAISQNGEQIQSTKGIL